jgi:hypothetical protein
MRKPNLHCDENEKYMSQGIPNLWIFFCTSTWKLKLTSTSSCKWKCTCTCTCTFPCKLSL